LLPIVRFFQRPGVSVTGVYLQTAPAELWQVERGGQGGVKTTCWEIGFAEKSNPATGTEIVIMTYFEFCG